MASPPKGQQSWAQHGPALVESVPNPTHQSLMTRRGTVSRHPPERRDRRETWEKTPCDCLRRNAIHHRTARRPARRLPIGVSKAAGAE
jgi:hypothetical protein